MIPSRTRAFMPSRSQIRENQPLYNSHDPRRPFWVPTQTIPHFTSNQTGNAKNTGQPYLSHRRQSYHSPNVPQQNHMHHKNGVLPYQNGVLPYQNGVLPYQNGVLPYQNGVSSPQYRNSVNAPPNHHHLPQQNHHYQNNPNYQQQIHHRHAQSSTQHYHYNSGSYPAKTSDSRAFPGAYETYEELNQDAYPFHRNPEGQKDPNSIAKTGIAQQKPHQPIRPNLTSPFCPLARPEASEVKEPDMPFVNSMISASQHKSYSAGDSESTCPPYTDSAADTNSSSLQYSAGRRPKRKKSRKSGPSSSQGSRKTSWAPSLFTDTDRASEIKAEKESQIEDILLNDDILFKASYDPAPGFRPSTPVYLRVYDLTEGMAEKISTRLSSRPVEAVYHTGIHVFGFEYFFGAGILKKLPEDVEDEYAMSYLRSEHLGNTTWTIQEFERFLTRIRDIFHPDQYDLLNWNCNDFTNVCTKRLLGDDFGIPEYIINQPVDANESALGKAAILGMKIVNKNVQLLGNVEAAFEKVRAFVEQTRLNWATRATS